MLNFIILNIIIYSPVFAANQTEGAKIFAANCAICHKQGKNVIIASKTLKNDALGKYLNGFNQDPKAAVINQVTHGKNAMPAFEGYLNPADIKAVAAYVVQQAETGW
ncbi:MAG: c-type cytochrome [Microcoleaceae cyanobacterium]